MPVFVDPRTGERFENVPDEDVARARTEFGLVTPEEFDHQQQVKEADEGFLPAVGQGFARGVGAQAAAIQNLTGFGTAPGLDEDAKGQKLPGGGLESLAPAYSEQARLQREARPFAAGLGTSLSVAPAAGLLGAGVAAAAPAAGAILGTTLPAIAAEAGAEAISQEYDDAWFEQRPFETQNVAANTLMFSGLDFAFRGALKGIGSALTGKPAAKPSIGGRNVVSEAQGAAREIVDPVGGGSVGAASANDLVEPFDDAIRQMSDQDAAVLARDANDHLYLISQDASESFTRLNNGLSDNLGSQLKYEDIGTYAQSWDAPTVARQENWWSGVTEEATSGIESLRNSRYDLGNLGKRAESTLDTFWRRVTDEPDPGRRMVTVDAFKKQLDRLTTVIDAANVDQVAKEELKSAIAPTREMLRKGLENTKLFGEAAELQRSLNESWHHLLESWRKVQSTLTEATGHVQFDTSGAGRITRESTVERMLAQLGKDPRSNQEFGRHLARTLEGIQGLIDARQAHGISRLDGLDGMASDIKNLMEDWNLASTIGVAKNRVDALKRDPRKWGNIVGGLAERLPMVGQPIQIARQLGNAFSDLHIEKGTPLARVWDSAYKRYALNPVYSDPSIIRNYPDWIAESLRTRGGKFTPPAGGITGGVPGVPSMPPANEGAVRGVAHPSLSAAGQSAVDRARTRIQQGGYNQLGSRAPLPADPAQRAAAVGKLQQSVSQLPDAGSLYDMPQAAYPGDEAHAAIQALTYEQRKALRDYTGSQYKQIRSALRGEGEHASAPLVQEALEKLYIPEPTKSGPLYRGLSVSDEGLNAALSQGEFTTSSITSTSANPVKGMGFARSAGMQGRTDLHPLIIKFNKADKGAPVNSGESEFLLPPGGHYRVTGRQQVEGVLMLEVEQVGKASDQQMSELGALGSVDLGPSRGGDGSNFSLGDVAKSPMGVVTGAGAAGLAINAAVKARAEQPPDSPDVAYRDALREIDQAGTQQVRDMATSALRTKPPRGKDRDPLALFAGKGKIQDMVEETRERLSEIAGDPMSLLQQLGSSAGELRRTHPGVYMAVTQKASQVAAYLQSVIPQRTATTLLDPRGAPVSFDRAWDFAARYVGATQPREALRQIVRGAAPPEMLEAVQQTWPELWGSFQVEMVGQVQRMHAAGRHIPAEKLRRLDRLLGLGGQLDPSASPEVTSHMLAAQDAEAARRQQQSQGGGQAPTGGATRAALSTTLDRVNQERTV